MVSGTCQKFGFIITRCVKTAPTNRYWNQCVKLIRYHYPHVRVVIIDDNSDPNLIEADHEYNNVTCIQSEYPGRGELLPFIYYLKHKWFENAIIIHDSVFIHKRIPFENMSEPVVPLWHHIYDAEHRNNLLRLANHLSHRNVTNIIRTYNSKHIEFNIGNKTSQHHLCFGVQCYINYDFLSFLERKYNITNLVHGVHFRKDRCGLERIFGLIFSIEQSGYMKYRKSLFGEIMKHYESFNYSFDEYMDDFKKGIARETFVKVWTGR
jgi:hypothetical protein